jgi:hypothetical protein
MKPAPAKSSVKISPWPTPEVTPVISPSRRPPAPNPPFRARNVCG